MNSEYNQKLCPQCDRLNDYKREKCENRKCNYVFVGGEWGAREPIRLNIINQIPTEAELSRDINLLSQGDISSVAINKNKTLERKIGEGSIVFIGGLLMLLFGLTIKLGGLLFIFAGVVAVVVGPIMIATILWESKKGSSMSTPHETINNFFSKGVFETEWLSLEPDDFTANYENAWKVLSPVAREKFKTLDAFENYWKKTMMYLDNYTQGLVGSLPNIECWIQNKVLFDGCSVKNIQVVKEDDNSVIVSFDVEIQRRRKQPRSPLQIIDSTVIFPQTRVLVKSNNKCFLTSGIFGLTYEEVK